ncbi:hypothetical protein KIL84_000901 [Mauremys mutica]|uniref:Uncharacterized protein n=1 Tax=Mauremys mutica TaxID=74926 RepID=A0A9D3WZA1_9SAUR|nr:hypothetical protein KIL84_000901 [Mauremys mutica]
MGNRTKPFQGIQSLTCPSPGIGPYPQGFLSGDSIFLQSSLGLFLTQSQQPAKNSFFSPLLPTHTEMSVVLLLFQSARIQSSLLLFQAAADSHKRSCSQSSGLD